MSEDQFEQRRAERRYAKNFLDFEIVSPGGETIGRGLARTLNVSATGLLLETGQFFEPGQQLRITLSLHNQLVQLLGKVIRSQPVDDELCCTGVQFIEFGDEEHSLYQRYFEALHQTGP